MDGTTMLPEFDHEMANTRRTLERVDPERFDWKPHEKSYSLKELATHLANIPSWVSTALTTEELDVGGDFEQPDPASTEEILELFGRNVAEGRTALETASRDDLMVPWTLLMDGETVLTMPRGEVLRSFVMNHMVHHRAQLTVYLRLLDIPVPALYGPSADEEQ